MKRILLITTLVFSLIACNKEDEVSPKMSSNKAKVIVDAEPNTVLGFGLRYLHPDGRQESVILKDTTITGDYEVEFTVDREQDFAYVIQKQDFSDKTDVKVRLIFRNYDQTKTFNSEMNFYDIYKFN